MKLGHALCQRSLYRQQQDLKNPVNKAKVSHNTGRQQKSMKVKCNLNETQQKTANEVERWRKAFNYVRR